MATQILGSIRGDVSLSTQKFQQGVSTINRQLQLVKSQFDASAAKARAFGKEEDRLRVQSRSLARQIDLQRQKVGLLARAHQEYARRLGTDAAATQRLGVQLNRARATLASMEGTQRRVNAQMRQTSQLSQRTGAAMQQLETRTRLVQSQFQVAEARARAFGTATDRLRVQQQGLAQNIELQRKRVSLLSLEYKEAAKRMGLHAAATKQAAIRLNEARAAMARMQGDLARVNTQMRQQSSIMARLGKNFSNIRGMAMDASVGIGIFGAAFGLAVGSAFRDSMAFEQAFAGVRKTVDATEAEFAELRQGIRNMAKEMPQAHEEIARVAEAAGQLGIQKDSILGFTRTMVDMGVATNLGSDDAAKALARLANITQMSQKDFDRLGSTVVALGNNLATTEAEIVEMGLRIAGAGHQVGMTEAQILSFAGALSSVGVKVEAGGTAISRVFLEMGTAVDAGGKKLDAFAKVAGMSAADFRKAFKKDAAEAVLVFIEGLGKMQKSGKNVVPTLKELSLNEIRVRDSLLRAAGAGDLFRRSIELGTKAWQDNTALTKEAEERYKTAASQMQIFRNRIRDIKITMADALMPVLLRMLNALDPMIDGIAKLAKGFEKLDVSTKDAVVAFGAVAGGIAVVGGALAALIALIGGPATVAIAGISIALGAFAALFVKWDDLKKKHEGLMKALSFVSPVFGLIEGIKKVQDVFSDAIPEVDRFGDAVSDSTKEALGAYFELEEGAMSALKTLYWSGDRVTKDTASTIAGNFDEMANTIIEGLNNRQSEIAQTLGSWMEADVIFPNERENEILGKITEHYDKQRKEVQKGEERIREIVDTASAEKRQITSEEYAEIRNIMLKWRGQAVENLTASEKEQKVIWERIRSNSSEISAREAAEIVKNSKKAYEGTMKEAKKTRDDRIAEAIFLRDELGIISEEEADHIIAQANLTYDKTVNKAKERHEAIVAEAQAQAQEHINTVDWETGEVLSKWEAFWAEQDRKFLERKEWWNNFWAGLGEDLSREWDLYISDTTAQTEEFWGNITRKWNEGKAWWSSYWQTFELVLNAAWTTMVNTITSKWSQIQNTSVQKGIEIGSSIRSKWEEIRSNTANAWENMRGRVSQKLSQMRSAVSGRMEEIRGVIRSKWERAQSYLRNINLARIGVSIIQGLIRGMNQKVVDLYARARSIADKVKTTIQSALGINSPARVMIPLGRGIGEGLALGMQREQRNVQKQAQRMAQAAIAGVGTAGRLAKTFSRSGGALGKYFRVVLEDGDYLNDWLTHIPREMRKMVQTIGELSTGDLFPDVYDRAKTRLTNPTNITRTTTTNKYYNIYVKGGDNPRWAAQEIIRQLKNMEALEGR
jgi:TP901 family phage tail tape measure protein